MSSLPPELWDHTIECLAPDRIAGPAEHYADLRACALTCQSWLPRAQHQLYKHVELRRLASIRLFARTLEHSPHLCPLVRRLEFWCIKGDPEWDPQGDEPDAEGAHQLRPEPIADVPFPAHLIRSLTALHGLRFACFTESPGHTEVVVEFLQKWTGCPGVRTLWLDGFYFNTLTELTEIVWSFPGLEEFNVFQTGWALVGLAVDPAEFPGRCEKLTNVEVRQCVSARMFGGAYYRKCGHRCRRRTALMTCSLFWAGRSRGCQFPGCGMDGSRTHTLVSALTRWFPKFRLTFY